jgi:putative transposase
LMHRAGVKGLPGSKRPRSVSMVPTSEDLVDRTFARSEPDQLWVTDITEHPTREGKVYCAVVLDAWSRRVVGWSIDSTPSTALVTNALGMAIDQRRPNSDTIIHSDQGTQPRFKGVYSTRHRLRFPAIDGFSRRLLRQCNDGIVLESDAGRAA